jgi:hypothetical protein
MPVPIPSQPQRDNSPRTTPSPRERRRFPPAARWSARRLDVLLELLERRKLTATELRMLLAFADGERPLRDLGALLDQPPAALRRTASRLRLDGMLRESEGRAFAITPRGLTALKPLLTAAGGRLR